MCGGGGGGLPHCPQRTDSQFLVLNLHWEGAPAEYCSTQGGHTLASMCATVLAILYVARIEGIHMLYTPRKVCALQSGNDDNYVGH